MYIFLIWKSIICKYLYCIAIRLCFPCFYLLIFSEKMGEPVKTEMVFVKDECGGIDVKKELVEEQDP